VFLQVSNYEAFWIYKIDIDSCVPKLTTFRIKSKDAKYPQELVDVLRIINQKRDVRRIVAASLKADWASTIKWAEYSPDKKLLIASNVNPSSWVMKNASVLKASTGILIKTVVCKDEAIEDVLWSSDSRHLVVLKSKERWSHSLYGLFRIIVGHPIPIETYEIEIFDFMDNTSTRWQFTQEIEFGTAVLSDVL